jgi:hypothetical protein
MIDTTTAENEIRLRNLLEDALIPAQAGPSNS